MVLYYVRVLFMKIFPCIVAQKSHKVICYVNAVLLSLLQQRVW